MSTAFAMPGSAPAAPSRRPPRLWRTRADRRRLAQRLAGGVSVESCSLLERCDAPEIHDLLGDASFAALVGHYRRLAVAETDWSLARLRRLAVCELELALEAVQIGTLLYTLWCHVRGLVPADLLAAGTLQHILRQVGSLTATRRLGRRVVPPAAPPAPPLAPGADDPSWAAEEAAVAVLVGMPAYLVRQQAALRQRLIAEAEREGVADPAALLFARKVLAAAAAEAVDTSFDPEAVASQGGGAGRSDRPIRYRPHGLVGRPHVRPPDDPRSLTAPDPPALPPVTRQVG